MTKVPMSNESLFWVVWNQDTSELRYKHPNIESARTEAKRLANMNPGQRFVILCAVEYVECQNPLTHKAYDCIPF